MQLSKYIIVVLLVIVGIVSSHKLKLIAVKRPHFAFVGVKVRKPKLLGLKSHGLGLGGLGGHGGIGGIGGGVGGFHGGGGGFSHQEYHHESHYSGGGFGGGFGGGLASSLGSGLGFLGR